MLGLPLSLWLTFSPVYLSTMGSGNEFGANLSYDYSKRTSIELNLGATTASDFKDRNGELNLDYKLTDFFTVETGFGFDQYDLYGAEGPTVDKNAHMRAKLRVF